MGGRKLVSEEWVVGNLECLLVGTGTLRDPFDAGLVQDGVAAFSLFADKSGAFEKMTRSENGMVAYDLRERISASVFRALLMG